MLLLSGDVGNGMRYAFFCLVDEYQIIGVWGRIRRGMGQDNRGMGLFPIYKMQQAEVDGHSRPHSKKSSPLLSYPDIQE